MSKICIFHKYLKVALYKIWSCIVLRNIIKTEIESVCRFSENIIQNRYVK